MASSQRKPTQNPQPLYPEVLQSNPDANSPFLSSSSSSSSSTTPLYPSLHDPPPAATTSSSMYPTIDMRDLVENLFPDGAEEACAVAEKGKGGGAAPEYPKLFQPPVEETLIRVPGAILHLIDRQRSVDLGGGEFSVVRLRQGDSVVAVLARVGDVVQWPLAKDEAAVRLDESHYFFSLHVPEGSCNAGVEEGGAGGGGDGSEDLLNYGLTFASKGQEGLLRELDGILEHYSSFSVQKVAAKAEVLDDAVAKETAPAEVTAPGPKREMMEERSAAYWTTLAPNVEDYSGCVARVIAVGSGQLIRGILWCGDVTVDRMKWGNDLLRSRMDPNAQPTEISKQALRRMKRVKRVTKMSEKVVGGVLSGVVKVSGFFTSSVVNSKAGKKFFSLLPGEIVLASLDGFGKICDAVEVVGKNVLSTSSTVTTGIVSHRYGEQAAELTNEGLDATGHAIGTAWAVFKIRKALNPKNSIKPSTMVKSAAKAKAAELKAKQAK